MTARYLGVLLIFAAGVLLLLQLRRRSREEILFLQDMAAALEQAETSVRFRCQPMPEIIADQSGRKYCGWIFTKTAQNMASGYALQSAFSKAIRGIPWLQAAQALSALELSGDVQRISANLRSSAAAMRELLRQRQADSHEKQKISLALTASGCGLLVILLL